MASGVSKYFKVIQRLSLKLRLSPLQSFQKVAGSTRSASLRVVESSPAKHLPAVSIIGSRDRSYSSGGGRKNLLYSLGFLSFAYAITDNDKEMTDSDVIQTADSLYEKNEYAQLYEHLLKQTSSRNAEILWRFARACRDYSQLSSTPKDIKRRVVYEGYKAAEDAVDIDDTNFACHKWFGIMLSEIGNYEGTKTKIQNSYKIRDHFQRAIELKKDDPTSHYLLGVWFFTFADLPWFQRKFAATIFASPPSCTYEEAQQCFLQAESIEPGFYTANVLMLARTCIKLGQNDEAKDWLNKLLDYTACTESDDNDINEGRKLLKSL